jgi:hypothetical protein
MSTDDLDDRFRHLTVDLLRSLPPDELGDAVVQHVAFQVGDDVSRIPDVVRSLPPGLRAIYTTYVVDMEVSNGGFNQFFWNPSSRYAEDALQGYELLGATEYAAVLRSALAIRAEEQERLAPYDRAGTLEAFSGSYQVTGLGKADESYYALGSRLFSAWASLLRRRSELFVV